MISYEEILDSLLNNYSNVEFIFSLEVDEFFSMIHKSIERDRNRAEERVEEMILHRWGYEIQLMEKPINLEEYMKLAMKSEDKGHTKKQKESNEELIKRIEELKKLDQIKSSKEGDL